MYQLARERIDLQSKLGELQSLVVKLLTERNMLHGSYQTALPSQTPAAPSTSPSAPSPAKRRRRTKPAHSQAENADGLSVVFSLALT